MERRREPRLQFTGTATLQLLGAHASTPIPAEVLDISGSGMRLRLPQPVPCGIPIQIDCGDTLGLGEICRCQPEHPSSPAGPFIAGIQLSQIVASMEELRRFSRRLDEFAAGDFRENTRSR